MSGNKKQKTAEDHHAARHDHPAAESYRHGTMNTQPTSGASDVANIYKFRNGKGDVLQTPKKSSIARAQALLAPSSPCQLTITGSNWPVAAVVTETGVETHLVQPGLDTSGSFTIGTAVKRQCTEE